MSFKVGIHENLIISKVAKNDKGSLVVGVRKVEDFSPLDRLNDTGSTSLEAEENDFLIYPPKNLDYQNNPLDYKQVLIEIANVKDPLDHILQQFVTKSSIKWNIFENTGITAENTTTELLKQTAIDKIYANIVEQFSTMIKPYVGDTTKKLRGVFPRQSKAKHYPALRKRFLDSQPIFEPMTVPVAASKIKFSDYEKEKGLDRGDQLVATTQATAEQKEKTATLFAKK